MSELVSRILYETFDHHIGQERAQNGSLKAIVYFYWPIVIKFIGINYLSVSAIWKDIQVDFWSCNEQNLSKNDI